MKTAVGWLAQLVVMADTGGWPGRKLETTFERRKRDLNNTSIWCHRHLSSWDYVITGLCDLQAMPVPPSLSALAVACRLSIVQNYSTASDYLMFGCVPLMIEGRALRARRRFPSVFLPAFPKRENRLWWIVKSTRINARWALSFSIFCNVTVDFKEMGT